MWSATYQQSFTAIHDTPALIEDLKRLHGATTDDVIIQRIGKRLEREQDKLARAEQRHSSFSPGEDDANIDPDDYPRSGLYDNNEPPKLLWSVDWYAHSVGLANDGHHLVRDGFWGSPVVPSLEGEAVTFFRDGKPIRTYRVGDLIKHSEKLKRHVSRYGWRAHSTLDPDALTYSLHTVYDTPFEFDATTGAIIDQHIPVFFAYDGTLTLLGGTEINVSQFRACGGDVFKAFTLKGKASAEALFGFMDLRQPADNATKEPTVGAILFDDLFSARRGARYDEGRTAWEISLTNGRQTTILINDADEYCYQDPDGIDQIQSMGVTEAFVITGLKGSMAPFK